MEDSYLTESDKQLARKPPDYTGLKIIALLLPVFVLIAFLANADTAITVYVVSGMILLAIRFHWDLSKYVWFCATIVFIFALHVPLFFWIRWPWGNAGGRGAVGLFGLADGLIILVIVELADQFFSKDPAL